MAGKIVKTNGIQIWVETFGNKDHPALLLMMGNSCDAFMWPLELCERLSGGGLYVIRYDQRDTGLSTKFDFSLNPYTLLDMAEDAIALLDHFNIQKAHILGYSTGGAVAQYLTLSHPEKAASLILMMTSIDLTIKNDAFLGKDMTDASLSPPLKEFIEAVIAIAKKEAKTKAEIIQQSVEQFKLANGNKSKFDESYFYLLFEESMNRTMEADGSLKTKSGHESNHALATSATAVLNIEQLKKIKSPTLVMAGEEDPIFPPDHPWAIAHAIPNSEFILIKNLGHILNPLFFDEIETAIINHVKHTRP